MMAEFQKRVRDAQKTMGAMQESIIRDVEKLPVIQTPALFRKYQVVSGLTPAVTGWPGHDFDFCARKPLPGYGL